VIDLPAIACTRPGEVVHAVRLLQKSDLVMAITFRRGLRQTVDGLRQVRARGAYCVGITDTHLSPLARFAHEYFVTSVESTLWPLEARSRFFQSAEVDLFRPSSAPPVYAASLAIIPSVDRSARLHAFTRAM
jgi:DNA-binding MurR/RpiR family transcriptional regulator